ncbi:MAG: hypothetical protein IT307_05095 [Chloroflexi bacterium]|nr:hypothetical protein [Chloroflexota bacterium]
MTSGFVEHVPANDRRPLDGVKRELLEQPARVQTSSIVVVGVWAPSKRGRNAANATMEWGCSVARAVGMPKKTHLRPYGSPSGGGRTLRRIGSL